MKIKENTVYRVFIKVLGRIQKVFDSSKKVTKQQRQSLDTSQLKILKKNIKSREVYWHVCTPKSASTFFMNYSMRRLTHKDNPSDYHFVSAVSEYRNREQFVCAYSLWERISHLPSESKIITYHQHCLPTADLLSLISNKHTVIVQIRGILDTLVSGLDHLKAASSIQNPWIINAANYWNLLSDEQKLDLQIIHYVPWHIAFIQGWLLAAEKNKNIKIIDFETVTANTSEVFNEIFSNTNVSIHDNEVELIKLDSKFNKGIKGRGKHLISEDRINQIKSMIEANDHLNQDLMRYL